MCVAPPPPIRDLDPAYRYIHVPCRFGFSLMRTKQGWANDPAMNVRTAQIVAVLGCPIYVLLLGPFGVLGIPIVTVALGTGVWPQLSRMRLLALGCVTLASMVSVYLLAVFWFYGLGAPSGAWVWVGPLVGLIVYLAGCRQALRRPWRWPLAVAVALLAIAVVGAIAMAMGVPFES